MAAACAAMAGGVALLRASWGLPRRAPGRNLAAWGMVILAAATGWIAEGAWGLAIAALSGMALALCLLGQAAITAPPGANRPRPARRTATVPKTGARLAILRRAHTFLLVAIIAPLVSLGLATAGWALAGATGLTQANAIVLALFAMPLVWAVLAFALLLDRSAGRRWSVLLAATAPCGIMIMVGTDPGAGIRAHAGSDLNASSATVSGADFGAKPGAEA